MNYIKILSLTLIIVICVGLTACGFNEGQDNTIATEKGHMLKYDLNTLYSKDLNGFYVKNKDNTFSPVMTGMENHSDNNNISSIFDKKELGKNFIWFCDTDVIKLKNIIPIASPKTPLVGFFKEGDDMPDQYYLEKYRALGYTLGCTFSLAEDQSNISLLTDPLATNSTMAAYAESEGVDGEYEVVKFKHTDSSGKETSDVPLQNIDGETGLLFGLQKNKPYEIGYYDGTLYKSTTSNEFVIRADTQAFKETEIINLNMPFKKSTGNYFKINLPENLEEGYYYINNYGLFYYSK